MARQDVVLSETRSIHKGESGVPNTFDQVVNEAWIEFGEHRVLTVKMVRYSHIKKLNKVLRAWMQEADDLQAVLLKTRAQADEGCRYAAEGTECLFRNRDSTARASGLCGAQHRFEGAHGPRPTAKRSSAQALLGRKRRSIASSWACARVPLQGGSKAPDVDFSSGTLPRGIRPSPPMQTRRCRSRCRRGVRGGEAISHAW